VARFAGLDWLSILGLRRLDIGAPSWADLGTGIDNGRTILRSRVATSQELRQYGRVLKDEFEIDFDVQTGLVSSVQQQQYADNSLDLVFPVVHKFSDYRNTNGVILPFRIEKYVQNRLVETITVNAIQLNPAL